jgi:hypothetical protein
MGTLTLKKVKKVLPYDLYELILRKKVEKEARVNLIKIVCSQDQPTLMNIFDIRERLVKGEVSFKEVLRPTNRREGKSKHNSCQSDREGNRGED